MARAISPPDRLGVRGSAPSSKLTPEHHNPSHATVSDHLAYGADVRDSGNRSWHSSGVAAKKSVAPRQRAMSKEHKAALALGRAEGSAVRRYLDALEAHTPRRGRKRTPESIERRLAAIEERIDEEDRLTALKLVQERMNLQAELESMSVADNLDDLAAEFIEVAANYSERQGITYAAWREVGVPAAVLREAGIGRGM